MPELDIPALLAWVAIAVGGVFVALVSWVAVRIVGRLDRLTELLQSDIRELLHQHDLRIARLEAKL